MLLHCAASTVYARHGRDNKYEHSCLAAHLAKAEFLLETGRGCNVPVVPAVTNACGELQRTAA